MTNARRFQLDELTLRPGTYFNPQTEIMIVVDDSPEVDHELFETRRVRQRRLGADRRGRPGRREQARRSVERFQLTHQRASELLPRTTTSTRTTRTSEDDDYDELDGVDDDLELDRE